MRKVTLLISLTSVLGATSIVGCGQSGSQLSSSMSLPGPGATPFPGSGTPSPAPSVLVTTLVDENGSNPDACSLREAIIANNNNADFGGCADPKGSIGFAPGLSGVIKLSGSSLPTTTANLMLNGPGVSTLTISGSNQFRVFDVGAGSNVEIKGLTISEGQSLGVVDNRCPDESGGGIRVNGGSLTVRNVTLTKNTSTCGGSIAVLASGNLNVIDSTVSDSSSVDGSGGGIFIRSGSTVTVDNTIFLNNKSDNTGGAIRFGSTLDGIKDALVTISSSQFKNNSSGAGGAISVGSGGQVEVNSSSFSQNSSEFGGAINNAGNLKIFDSSINQNSADFGGGIVHLQPGMMMLSNVSVSENQSIKNGGGIANNASMTIENSMIQNNTSSQGFGGGVINSSSLADGSPQIGILTIRDSSILNNSAQNSGGGINAAPNSTVNISGSTIQGNKGDFGGGIQVFEATLTISDSTVSGNKAIQGGGGIEQFKGSVTASGNKITGNTAGFGGGIRNFDGLGKLTLTNNTFVPANTPDNVRGGLGGGTGSGNNPGACNIGVCP
ncbi:MAG: CSLREA domain-containing protein [Synechococcaceae cyanobacterium SM2_3_2]|nr:CSLREA domain-containing protein [Synechococcaceae cyanobacterium SM2_3_2]